MKYLLFIFILLNLAACAVNTKKYEEFRKSKPKSILVLPPINNTKNVIATYGVLSTISKPIVDMGYYVFPVAVIDQMLKENGLHGPNEMHQASLKKIYDIIAPDTVLYIVIDEYGPTYNIFSSATIVSYKAQLVDTKTGVKIWEGETSASDGGGTISSNLALEMVVSVVSQIVDTLIDNSYKVARIANKQLYSDYMNGLLKGSRHEQPDF